MLRSPRTTPPLATKSKLTPFSPEIREYVSWFEYLVAPTAKRAVTTKRRNRWIGTTLNLLLDKDMPLADLVALTQFVFEDCGGLLPFDAFGERKVTRVLQIAFNLADIREAKALGITTHDDTQKEQPRMDLSKPLADKTTEARVTTLTGLWKATKRHTEPSTFEVARWRKEFRLLLAQAELPYDDLTQVVTALADPELELDSGRYTSPAHLYDREEWQHIHTSVSIALLRREMQSSKGPARRPVHRRVRPEHG